MKKMFLSAFCAATMGIVSFAGAADTANLSATIIVKGKLPEPKAVGNVNDPFCQQFKIMTEDYVVDASGALRNFAIYADSKKLDASAIPADQKKPQGAQITIDNKQCRFEPHVISVRAGQMINVTNSDKTGHNASFPFLSNEAENFQIPAGGNKTSKVLANEEPAPIPVNCGSHPWMKGYVIIQDHPFVGISDEKGKIEIKGLPSGKVTLRVWQEAGKVTALHINGKKVSVTRGRIELDLKPGNNDLGKVEVEITPQ